MSYRENPATVFIAQNVSEHITGLSWRDLDTDERSEWMACASNLIIDMYHAGFTIPQPENPDAVWASLSANANEVRR